jgi:hypothetical protein
MTLEMLVGYYARERERTSAMPIAEPDGAPPHCRYCGKHWRHWAGSKLDGHAQCIVGDQFKRSVARVFYSDPRISIWTIANALGVSYSVVRAWITCAEKQAAA